MPLSYNRLPRHISNIAATAQLKTFGISWDKCCKDSGEMPQRYDLQGFVPYHHYHIYLQITGAKSPSFRAAGGVDLGVSKPKLEFTAK